MVAIDTLSPSNAECERGFSAVNNIITDSRNAVTTNNAEKQLFVSIVRERNGIQGHTKKLGLEREEEQLIQQVAWLNKT